MTATVSAEELARVKAYCRIEDDTDDDLIEQLYLAAKQYLATGGVAEPEDLSLDPQYQLMCNALTLHYYDHRDATASAMTELPLGLRSMINQRKLTGADATIYST